MDLKKSIGELEAVLGEVEILDEKAVDVMRLARAYLSDSKHFIEKGEDDDALEAYAIAWAYLDALLHFGFADVSNKELFTVEPDQ